MKNTIKIFLDSPVSDRFISPAPGQPNIRMAKQIVMNENRQLFSASSRINSVTQQTIIGPSKKIGTLGLFFRKVSNHKLLIFLTCSSVFIEMALLNININKIFIFFILTWVHIISERIIHFLILSNMS